FPGRLSEAELYCKKAIELDSDNPVFYFNLGFLYQRHNLSEAAQQSFIRAQEAQQVRQAKHSAQQTAAISAHWRGDADSLLKELDSIEETMAQPGDEQPSVISLPQAEEPIPEKYESQQPAPVPETEPETVPAAAEELSDHSGIDDLLSELDSLESSMEKVETYNNGKAAFPEEPEAAPLEIVTAKDELVALIPTGEQQPSPEGPAEPPPLEIVTAKDELISQMPSGEPQASMDSQPSGVELEIVTVQEDLAPVGQEAPVPEPALEPDHASESTLDLLKELDSIESMVAGIEQAEAGNRLETGGSAPETGSDDLEDEALKLLQELDVPLDDKSPEPPEPAPQDETTTPDETKAGKNASETDSEAIKKKMERLNQMEEQMMEELLKLKAEREQLRAGLKV
ncbi:MAG: tetratricopeptide repeat protein, partial [bacterium]|nr:tetratricopeptide repeat protein [bacterium]